jgi:hypothetical protein
VRGFPNKKMEDVHTIPSLTLEYKNNERPPHQENDYQQKAGGLIKEMNIAWMKNPTLMTANIIELMMAIRIILRLPRPRLPNRRWIPLPLLV